MDISFLEKQNFIELKELVDELSEEFNNMNTKNKTKKELVNMIYLFFKDYEKTDKKFKKTRIENKDTSSSISSSNKKYTTLCGTEVNDISYSDTIPIKITTNSVNSY